jgi:HK97 family phage prohead protease
MSDLTLDALGSVQNRLANMPELRATVEVDEQGRQIYTALAYDLSEPDRHGTTMTPGSLDADLNRGVPLMLWHDRESFPVGKVISWEHTERGPVARFIFADYDKAHLARTLVDTGFLQAVSVGFIPKEGFVREADDVVVFTRSELVELSLTATPSSRGALIDLKRSIDDLAGSADVPSDEAPAADVEPANPESDTVEAVELAVELDVTVEEAPAYGADAPDARNLPDDEQLARWQRAQRMRNA